MIGMVRCSSWILVLTLVGQIMPVVADQPAAVRIAGSAWIGDAPTRLADHLDLFNQGRKVSEPRIEVLQFGSGHDAVVALMRGEAEFALGATTPVAVALMGEMGEAGNRPVVLASLALSNRSHRIVVLPESGIRQPQDIQGRRVGVMMGTSSHFGWFHFSRFHGLDESSVELVDLPVSAMAEAMLNGRIDAAVVWDPWDVELARATGTTLIEFPLDAIYTVNWLLLADRQLAMSQPELLERVLHGYQAALARMDSRSDETLSLLAGLFDTDVDSFLARTDGLLWRLGMNWSVLVSLGAQFDWLTAQPAFGQQPAPSPSDYLLGEPLRRLSPRLVTVPPYLMVAETTSDTAP